MDELDIIWEDLYHHQHQIREVLQSIEIMSLFQDGDELGIIRDALIFRYETLRQELLSIERRMDEEDLNH